jgi:hypothetical protein
MSNLNYTKGPWKVTPWRFACPELGRTIVAELRGDDSDDLQIRSDHAPGDKYADANMLAEAPEMYKLIKRVREWLYNYPLDRGEESEIASYISQKCEIIVAKVEGNP